MASCGLLSARIGIGTSTGRGDQLLSDACSDRMTWPRRARTRESGVDSGFMALGVEIVGTDRMCSEVDFRGSAVSNRPTQEKPNLFRGTVPPVMTPPARSAVAGSVPLRPDPCLPSGSERGLRTAVHATLVAFLAWAALLFAGLGGTVGGVSQALAGKLAASAQHLQRQAGSSAASRALRRELPAVAAELTVARASVAALAPQVDIAPPVGGLPLLPPALRAEVQAHAVALLRAATRHRTPPSRAPPVLA